MKEISEFLNKIICGDCLEVMKEIPSESVDLIITSPPYNLGKNHHTGNNRFNPYNDDLPENDYQLSQINVLKECYRVLKITGSLFYNHKNRIKDGVQISPYKWLYYTPFIIKQELIWENGSQNFDKIRFYPMTERIYWLAKQKETKLVNNVNHQDFWKRDEWKPVKTKGSHKRAFPLQFPLDIISCFPDSKVILDPYVGSGTVALAAKQLNKDFIGIELNQDYLKIAEQRLKENK
jgi:modification methylase